jgi:hypothetical protein
MEVVEQLIQLLQAALGLVLRGLETGLRLIPVIWEWTVTQIVSIPWNRLDNLPLWKIVVLCVTGGAAGWLVYFAGRTLVEAGEKVLTHFVGFVAAFIRTILPILLAGILAAGGAWIINNVNFNLDRYNHASWPADLRP